MLKVITTRKEISLCAKELHSRLKKLFRKKGEFTLGYQAGNFEDTVYHNLRLWYSGFITLKRIKPCFWNAFGTELRPQGSNDIVVEINVPMSGIYRRLSGLFAKDPVTNEVFLLHRGKIGGGRKGIGKSALADWYRGEWVDIEEGRGGVGKAILITSLGDPGMFENLAFFVEEIARFKKASPSLRERRVRRLTDDVDSFSYNPEFAGAKKGTRPSKFVAECNHGRVVSALEALLRRSGKSGAVAFFNNRSIDLGVTSGKRITGIYEIKTDTGTQSIYTGIGQLMFHAAHDPSISKTLVLPVTRTANKSWTPALKRLSIALLEYELSSDGVSFVNF